MFLVNVIKACEQHSSGDTASVLETALGILEQLDVGYFRRAVVNLFVAKIGDMKKLKLHLYVFESFDLIDKLREDGIPPGAEDLIDAIEKQALDASLQIYAQCLEHVPDAPSMESLIEKILAVAKVSHPLGGIYPTSDISRVVYSLDMS